MVSIQLNRSKLHAPFRIFVDGHYDDYNESELLEIIDVFQVTLKKWQVYLQENPPLMKRCEFCDLIGYRLEYEGTQCGIGDCLKYTCCERSWKVHLKKDHFDYFKIKYPHEVEK